MKKCKVCGKEFEPKPETRQKYCSLECSAEANRKNARERDRRNRWVKNQVEKYKEENLNKVIQWDTTE